MNGDLRPSRKHAYIILIPLKSHFYIVKLGFTGICIIFFFIISAQNIDCGYLWEAVLTSTHDLCFAEAALTSTHNLCFEQKYEKYQSFLSEKFQFLVVKFSISLNRCVYIMLINLTLNFL